jgi:protein-disulfide isomerase
MDARGTGPRVLKGVAALMCLMFAAVLLAQDWKTATTLEGVDLSGLSPGARGSALNLLRMRNCPCGCEMKLAECRTKDPACSYSKGIANIITTSLKSGKSVDDTIAAVEAAPISHPRSEKILDDPVTIRTDGAPVLGPANARITIVEFSDFQCPYCAQAVKKVDAVMKAYPTQVKLIFKQFPLDQHSQAELAAQAALAAQQQGKFWQLHDLLFANRTHLSRQEILTLAGGLGMDMVRFTRDMDAAETKKAVERDEADGEQAGVGGTPTFFIDGQRYNGSIELDAIRPILDAELKKPVKK